jgi:hypothetical protein
MVCVIIDTNLAFRIFTSEPEDDFRPVFDWLHAPDKDGRLVFGGKLAGELANRTTSLGYLRALVQAGRAYLIPDRSVQAEEREVTCSALCKSNDSHVIALARVSGARTLCSHDRALQQDFRNPKLISKPRGHVYQNPTHRAFLCHVSSCRRYGPQRQRRRK